jgi:uncharacterized protein (DUF2252 family)
VTGPRGVTGLRAVAPPLSPPPGPRPDPDARAAAGRAARARAPLAGHAGIGPGTGRDPLAVLAAQAATRVPDLVPIRYGRMLASPLAFYRGSAAVMAADLAGTPVSGLACQLCGDAHLANFGMFGTPERRLVFDLNDFDETYPGPWEWDLKRLVTSLVVAGRDNGFGRKRRRAVALAAAAGYQAAMARFAGMGELAVWYARADLDELGPQLARQLSKARRERWDQARARARGRDSLRATGKLTAVVAGRRRFVADPPLLVPVRDLLPDLDRDRLAGQLHGLLAGYRHSLPPDRRRLLDRFELIDVARKVVGVGSVGTRCWVLLLRGRDDGDPLLLQVKEAGRSVLAGHLPAGTGGGADRGSGAGPGGEGERVVGGQRLMQAASDIFLGWVSAAGVDGARRDFGVRQLRDWKGSAVVDTMDPGTLRRYGELCAWTLARAHARTGDRIAIASYLDGDAAFDHALLDFAERYADRVEADHGALAAAVRAGRVAAETGV